jgi:hypothetical protein
VPEVPAYGGTPMIITDVQQEIADKLVAAEIGLNVTPFDADAITPPALLFGIPERYTFDATYSRGADSFVLPLVVMVGRANVRASRALINEYISGSGPKSVKSVVDDSDSNEYTTCDSVTITDVELDIMTLARIDYRAAIFNAMIYGPGS